MGRVINTQQENIALTGHPKFSYTMKRSSSGEPSIEQQSIAGVAISWNPDDEQFYVSNTETHEALARGKSWRNIVFRANGFIG